MGNKPAARPAITDPPPAYSARESNYNRVLPPYSETPAPISQYENDRRTASATRLCAALSAGRYQSAMQIMKEEVSCLGVLGTTNSVSGLTALHIAATAAPRDIVEFLIDNGADVNVTTSAEQQDQREDMITPLCSAIASANVDNCRLLIDRGARVNVIGATFQPIFHAVVANNVEIVEMLIAAGADVKDDPLLMRTAAEKGNRNIVMLLLDAGADVGHSGHRRSMTALHCAALNGHDRVVEMLIDRGADVNAVCTDQQMTPLHLSACEGHLSVCRVLIERGAKLDAININRLTPVLLAFLNKHFDVAKLLLDAGASATSSMTDGMTLLHMAADQGDLEMVQILLAKGADVNAATYEGQIPINYAITKGHLHVVKFLVHNGACVGSPICRADMRVTDAGLADQSDQTSADNKSLCRPKFMTFSLSVAVCCADPRVVEMLLDANADINECATDAGLMWAARKSYEPIAKLLVDRGADVLAVSATGQTAVWFAAEGRCPDLIELFAERGVDVNAPESEAGTTPLMKAAATGNSKSVQVLLNRGARVNDVTSENESALFYAVRGGQLEVLSLLVESGSEVNAQLKSNGNTCMIYATESGNLNMVRLLFEQGANVNVYNSRGQAPIHIAAGNGHLQVIRYLLDKGVPVDAKTTESNQQSTTPLSAVKNRFTEFVMQLTTRGGITPLLLASIAGHFAVVRLLLDRGAEVNDPSGLPLVMSAQNGHVDVVKALLAKGADFTVNPLLTVAYTTGTDCIAVLRGPKIQLTLVMSNKLSASENALKIRQVLANAADLVGNGASIESPLYWAAQRGYVDVVRVMLESRPDGFIDCLPALSAAVRFGQSEELIDILTSRALRQEQLEYIKVD